MEKSKLLADIKFRVGKILSSHCRNVDSATGGYSAVPSSRFPAIFEETTSALLDLATQEVHKVAIEAAVVAPDARYFLLTDMALEELQSMVRYGGIPPNVVGIINSKDLDIVEAERLLERIKESIAMAKLKGKTKITISRKKEDVRPRI